MIDRLVDDQVQFGFSDAQAKFVYDLSPSQRVQLTVLAGRSRLKEPEEEVDAQRSLRRAERLGDRHRHLAVDRGPHAC